jgi:hypothetical protein
LNVECVCRGAVGARKAGVGDPGYIGQFGGFAEEGEQRLHVFDGGGLVEGEADGHFVEAAEVEFLRLGGGVDAGRGDVADGERVEDGLGVDLGADVAEAGGEKLGKEFHATGDLLEALGPVINGIH